MDTADQRRIHNLVKSSLLRRLRSLSKDKKFIERVPSDVEVSNLLHEMQEHSDSPVADRFRFCPRDGSISIVHKRALVAEQTETRPYVHLVTTTQDYTFRCKSDYKENWSNVKKIYNTEHIPIVLEHFDPLQKFILGRTEHYLHSLHYHEHKDDDSKPPTYIIETAPRYKSIHELDVGRINIEGWKYENSNERRPANNSEITLWAVLTLVKPEEQYDTARLEFIRSAIASVNPENGQAIGISNLDSNTTHDEIQVEHRREEPLVVPGYNIFKLLCNRPHNYRDGRARFPLICAAVHDQSLLRPWSEDSARKGLFPLSIRAKKAPMTSYSESTDQLKEVNEYKSNVPTLLMVFTSTLLVSSIGLLYLLRLRHDPDEDVPAITVVIVAFLLPLSFTLFTRIATGDINPMSLLQLRVKQRAPKLLEGAASMPVESAARVQVVRTEVARKYWNGDGLSFGGGTYSGSKRLPEKDTFWVSELLHAGFQTGYRMDGREVLVTPEGELLQLEGVGKKNGRGIFASLIRGEDEEKHFIREARGVWWRDVEVGFKEDLGDSYLS